MTDDLMRRWAPGLIERLSVTISDRQDQSGASSAGEPGDDGEAVEEIEDKDVPKHTGVMIAFFPSPQQQDELSVPGGEEPEELHLTLAYLGTVGIEVPDTAEAQIIAEVSKWAARVAPVSATLAGIGVFTADVVPVTYASVDAPTLPGIRQDLIERLTVAGLPALATHGYTPHITLAYDDLRNVLIPSMNLLFTSVVVVFAGQQTAIPLGGTAQRAASISPAFTQPHGITFSGPSTVMFTMNRPATDDGPVVAVEPEEARAFVTDINGHTMVSGPATTLRASLREPTIEDITAEHMLWMHGKFVGAEVPNRNGALWSAGDLAMSKGSVVNGPLNWLHEGRHIIGSLAKSEYVDGVNTKAGAGSTIQPHLTATAGIWKWIYPDEAFVVNQASDLGQLWYSMECISSEVSCAGPDGCGNTTSYTQYLAGAACEHITQRASIRQFLKPVFLGGAVIVPPTRPGWAEADASVMSQASRLAEAAFDQAGEPDIEASTWEQMMAQLVKFAQR
jgi:2'-5' RNA ligase